MSLHQMPFGERLQLYYSVFYFQNEFYPSADLSRILISINLLMSRHAGDIQVDF